MNRSPGPCRGTPAAEHAAEWSNDRCGVDPRTRLDPRPARDRSPVCVVHVASRWPVPPRAPDRRCPRPGCAGSRSATSRSS
ncbi:hypothetical protein SGPA1_21455 [Streptomyces misionensis JCM 4497]